MFRYVFFFFKQKTAYEMRISDWSSDVCSSDLIASRGYFRNDCFNRLANRKICFRFALIFREFEPARHQVLSLHTLAAGVKHTWDTVKLGAGKGLAATLGGHIKAGLRRCSSYSGDASNMLEDRQYSPASSCSIPIGGTRAEPRTTSRPGTMVAVGG